MKTVKLLAIIAFAMLISTCAKDKSPTTSDTPPVSLLEVTNVLTAAEDKFIEFGQSSGTTPQGALGLTAEWLKSQPDVSTVFVEDNTAINIKMKSGISSIFFLDIMDKDGISISRGGGSGGSSLKLFSTNQTKNTIENKKVLLCYPNLDEFYKADEVKKIVDRLKSSDLGLEVTEKDYDDVTPDLVSTFGDYGLVILDTHGKPDSFLSGGHISFIEEDSTEQMVREWVIYHFSQKTLNNFDNGLLRLGMHVRTSASPDWIKHYVKSAGGFTIWIGSEYINSLPPMPNTIIFGNFCFSGQTNPSKEDPNPIGAAFKNLNLISYYCYDKGGGNSSIVSNPFAKAMEDSLIKAFVIDNDSTGNANLSYTGDEFVDPSFFHQYLKQFGAKDYSYKMADPTLVAVTGGTFQMGNALDEEASPVHSVTVGSFFIERYEVTYEKWTEVRNWALKHGYASNDIAEGLNGASTSGPSTSGANNPVAAVNWYDILKWCNARSEMDGLKPVYYTDNKLNTLYRSGQINITTNAVLWSANGYRLPTEAEWEFAARGGTKTGNYKYSGSNTVGDVAWWYMNSGNTGKTDYTTHPVGQKTPNELGLYDMSGNVLEWCWDFLASYPSTPQTDPKGSPGGGAHVCRGGLFNLTFGLCESTNRHMQYGSSIRNYTGFRCAAD